jgi:hypothetical protein
LGEEQLAAQDVGEDQRVQGGPEFGGVRHGAAYLEGQERQHQKIRDPDPGVDAARLRARDRKRRQEDEGKKQDGAPNAFF